MMIYHSNAAKGVALSGLAAAGLSDITDVEAPIEPYWPNPDRVIWGDSRGVCMMAACHTSPSTLEDLVDGCEFRHYVKKQLYMAAKEEFSVSAEKGRLLHKQLEQVIKTPAKERDRQIDTLDLPASKAWFTLLAHIGTKWLQYEETAAEYQINHYRPQMADLNQTRPICLMTDVLTVYHNRPLIVDWKFSSNPRKWLPQTPADLSEDTAMQIYALATYMLGFSVWGLRQEKAMPFIAQVQASFDGDISDVVLFDCAEKGYLGYANNRVVELMKRELEILNTPARLVPIVGVPGVGPVCNKFDKPCPAVSLCTLMNSDYAPPSIRREGVKRRGLK